MPTLKRYLTAEEFIQEMDDQDIRGKHGTIQPHWETVANYAVANAVDPSLPPFVLVRDIPITWLVLEHLPESSQRAEDYSRLDSAFPPVYISLSSYQLHIDPTARPQVKNGNHRVVAARIKGDKVIDAIMDQDTWNNLQVT